MKHLIIIAIIALLSACSKQSAVAPIHTVDTLYISGAQSWHGVDTATAIYCINNGSELWISISKGAIDTATKIYSTIYCQFDEKWEMLDIKYITYPTYYLSELSIVCPYHANTKAGRIRLPWVRK